MTEVIGREAYGDDHLVDFHVVDLEVVGAFVEPWGNVALKLRDCAINRPARKIDIERCTSLVPWEAGMRWYRQGEVDGGGKSNDNCWETHGEFPDAQRFNPPKVARFPSNLVRKT